jgi:hypothetical protein
VKKKGSVHCIVKRLLMLSLLVITASAFALTSVSFAAESDSVTWDHSKSKTATKLNNDYTSEVTLSLPSKEEKLSSDIVFVMDKSSCREETADKMKPLLTQLQSALKNSDATVKIAMVAFDGTDHTLYPLTTYDGSDKQIQTIQGYAQANSIPTKEHVSGTNMQAGLDRAQKILDADSSVPANRKYVVLVSDGLTRLFGTDGNVKDIYYKGDYSYNHLYGMIDEWDQIRFGKRYGSDTYDPYRNNTNWTWSAYWSQVQNWVAADGDKYVNDFLKYGNDAGADGMNNYLTDSGDDAASKHAMAVDRAVYEAYNAYAQLAKTGYRCYAINVGTSKFGGAFMNALNDISGNGENVSFDQMRNDILYVVGAGSSVEDYIGYSDQYNFDLIQPEKMKIVVDNTENGQETTYDAVKINDNQYGVGPKLDNGKYSYEVTYTPGDKKAEERFVWTMNVNVSNFSHVSLKYTVKLKNPKSASGTYGQLDLNGDGVIDGTNQAVDTKKALYTNASATLKPVDSLGHAGAAEAFGKPSVAYTMKAADGKPNNKDNSALSSSKKLLNKTAKTPRTGDSTNTMMWVLMMIAAAGVCSGTVMYKKFNKKHAK